MDPAEAPARMAASRPGFRLLRHWRGQPARAARHAARHHLREEQAAERGAADGDAVALLGAGRDFGVVGAVGTKRGIMRFRRSGAMVLHLSA